MTKNPHRARQSRPLMMAFYFLSSNAFADPMQMTAECMSGMRSELDRINAEMLSVESEQAGGGYLVTQEGRCARMLKRIDHFLPTVLQGEVDKMERKACLEIDKLKIDNYCRCGANLGDTSLPDDQTVDDSINAEREFREQVSKVRKRGIKNPAIEGYVGAGQQLLGCWSAKSVAMLKRASNLIEPALTVSPINGGNPSISPIDGGNPSVSAINGGNPSISAIDGGAPPASGISGGPQSNAPGGQSSPSTTVTYSAPPSSAVSGTTNSPSPPQYTTSGPATNVTQDIINFQNAYSKSSEFLRTPPPVVHSAPSRPSAPMQPPHSGISGTHH